MGRSKPKASQGPIHLPVSVPAASAGQGKAKEQLGEYPCAPEQMEYTDVRPDLAIQAFAQNAVEEALQEANNKIEALETEIDDRNNRMGKAGAMLTSLRDERAMLRNQVAQLTQEKDVMVEEVKDMRERVSRQQKELEKMAKRIKELEKAEVGKQELDKLQKDVEGFFGGSRWMPFF